MPVIKTENNELYQPTFDAQAVLDKHWSAETKLGAVVQSTARWPRFFRLMSTIQQDLLAVHLPYMHPETRLRAEKTLLWLRTNPYPGAYAKHLYKQEPGRPNA
jgi:hypothetical protein